MSSACIHMGFHNHLAFIKLYCESLDVVFQCVANEVSKTPSAKNSAIVMAAKIQLLAYYISKSLLPWE